MNDTKLRLIQQLEALMEGHEARPVGSPNCKCGWRPSVHLNDIESDRGQHRFHQVTEAVNQAWDDIYAIGYTDGFSDKTKLEGDVSVYEVVDRHTRRRILPEVYLSEHQAFRVIEKNQAQDSAMVQAVTVAPKEES